MDARVLSARVSDWFNVRPYVKYETEHFTPVILGKFDGPYGDDCSPMEPLKTIQTLLIKLEDGIVI